MSFNVQRDGKKRVVIIGGGFGGLKLARDLKNSNYQVVLVDKNNYHQFPPLIYQIATAGLNPSSISFPFRKIFQNYKDFYYRMAEFRYVNPDEKVIQTSIGKIDYDYLVFATGTTTNFFGNKSLKKLAIPMKTVTEAMGLRNSLLSSYERSVTCSTQKEKDELLNIVIVGGGPSGVEIAGAIAEMRNHILQKDYPDMDISKFHIHLIQGADRLLPSMNIKSSQKAFTFLSKMNVDIKLKTLVTDYVDNEVILNNGQKIPCRNLIWVGGVTGTPIEGILPDSIGRGNRLIVDEYSRVKGYDNIFAIGDIALMHGDKAYENGHPQMAQPAIQQGANLALNLKLLDKNKNLKPFVYKDLGSMATIGKNKAVANIMGLKFSGFIAWVLWMGVHLMSILGIKNKVFVFLDWFWSYFNYDRSNRMILKAFQSSEMTDLEEKFNKDHW